MRLKKEWLKSFTFITATATAAAPAATSVVLRHAKP
jgi:hypothetical protein